MYTPGILPTLNDIGLIGSWHIDFTSSRMRGDGRIGDFFGLPREKVAAGVDLNLLDSAYLPEDLEMVKRNRRKITGMGGRCHLEYKLKSPEQEQLVSVRSLMNVSIGRYGELQQARGILYEAPDPPIKVPNKDVSYEDVLRVLTDAATGLSQLGYEHLKPIVQYLFKEVAQDAILKALKRDP